MKIPRIGSLTNDGRYSVRYDNHSARGENTNVEIKKGSEEGIEDNLFHPFRANAFENEHGMDKLLDIHTFFFAQKK